MSFARTDEQRLLEESLRRFLDHENGFEDRRKRLASDPPQRMALWPALVELGIVSAAFDEAHGGLAGDARTIASIMAELGRSLAVEPYLACAIVAGKLLGQSGPGTSALEIAEQIMGGKRIVVLAHSCGPDPFALPTTIARSYQRTGWLLNGDVACVRHADVADEYLVTTTIDGKVAIFRVAKNADGLTASHYRLMDGVGSADLHLRNVAVDATSILQFDGRAEDAVKDALEWGLLAAIAETSGIVDSLNRATFEYLGTRKQFGQVLASFQALQHRAADMFIAAEELRAIAELAIDAMGGPPSGLRSSVLSAAKVVADRAGRLVGHDAIQMHGGMGVSDELSVSHLGRRLAVIRSDFGSSDVHKLRFAAADVGAMLALTDTKESGEWRVQVRNFVRQHLPKDIARKVELGLKIDKDDYVRWQKVLRDHDWFAGVWPREHGGLGWDLRKQLVFVQEAAICNAPMIIPYGVGMVGPVLYSYGTDEQRRRHLPGILSSDVWWCQGYSEPGAGSDLASLKTSAVLDGDHYVVNGSKMWTTEAHWADWMHCLVRTDRSGKPQVGITFLLIDMKTPGIEIKPIVTIDGIHHTNAVFFDNVRVPVANRVGEEGRGWSLAKFLLGNERVSIADTGPKLRLLRRVRELHASAMRKPEISDELKVLLSAKLSDVSIQLITLCALEQSYIGSWTAGTPPGADASSLKVRGTEVLQAMSELALELEGPMAAAHDPADLHRNPSEQLTLAQHASLVAHEYLYGRCWSVFGGTNEIQRNIIAKQALGV